MAKKSSTEYESPHQKIKISWNAPTITVTLTPKENAAKDDYIQERIALKRYLLNHTGLAPYSPPREAKKNYKLVINVPKNKSFDYGYGVQAAIEQLWESYSPNPQMPPQSTASAEAESALPATTAASSSTQFQNRIRPDNHSASLKNQVREILENNAPIDSQVSALIELFSERSRAQHKPSIN